MTQCLENSPCGEIKLYFQELNRQKVIFKRYRFEWKLLFPRIRAHLLFLLIGTGEPAILTLLNISDVYLSSYFLFLATISLINPLKRTLRKAAYKECPGSSTLHKHWEGLWVHIRNWFSLTKVNTGYGHFFVTRTWGSYSNDPSLPFKPVTWPDFFQWAFSRWFISLHTRTHPHVVAVVFPVKAQTRLIRLWPLPPCRRWDTLRGCALWNSSLHLCSRHNGWTELQELVCFSPFLSLSPLVDRLCNPIRAEGCLTSSPLRKPRACNGELLCGALPPTSCTLTVVCEQPSPADKTQQPFQAARAWTLPAS